MKSNEKKLLVIALIFLFVIIIGGLFISSITGSTVAQFFTQLFSNSSSSKQSISITSAGDVIIRTLPSCYTPGQAFQVSISVTPASSNSNWALSENVPSSWPVTNVGNGGSYIASSSYVRWAFDGNTATTLTYSIIPPSSSTGVGTFSGIYSNGTGITSPIGGSSSIGLCSSPPINGVCGYSTNYCINGTFSDVTDNSTHFLWRCLGLNSGSNVNCSLTKTSPVLTLSKSGSYSLISLIRVVNYPGSINCGVMCSSNITNFLAGTSVSVLVTPSPGAKFVSWTGSGSASSCTLLSNTTTTCTFTINSNGNVNAQFAARNGYTG